MEQLLQQLKALLEGQMLLQEWEHWWHQHHRAIEPLVSRRIYLFLKKRPLLAAEELLYAHHIAFQPRQFQCRSCGEMLFLAMPGETTQGDIVAFASRAKISGREQILKTRWIHPGLYCPNGCTIILWHVRHDPEVEAVSLTDEEQQAWEEQRRIEKAEKAKTPWGERVCSNCGKRLSSWADNKRGRCGYCRHPLPSQMTPNLA